MIPDGDEDKKVMETEHVIQTLFDDVKGKLDGIHQECLETEHKNSILMEYSFNQHILKIPEVFEFSEYFMDLFSKFVLPMEHALKSQILIPYKLINEGELFCSDFKYRFSDAKTQDYMGVVGKSSEDTMNDIQEMLNQIINKYRKEYLEFCDEKVGEKKKGGFIKNMSRALYFVSYLEIENQESQKLARDNE